jgi:hypothetical protein
VDVDMFLPGVAAYDSQATNPGSAQKRAAVMSSLARAQASLGQVVITKDLSDIG